MKLLLVGIILTLLSACSFISIIDSESCKGEENVQEEKKDTD